jgi:hypothetical protein
MRPTIRAYQHGVALGEITRVGGARHDFHQPAIAVLAVPGRDPFRDNGRFCVFADVNHFGAGICLLMPAGQCHGEELTDGVIAAQDATGVFPGDG